MNLIEEKDFIPPFEDKNVIIREKDISLISKEKLHSLLDTGKGYVRIIALRNFAPTQFHRNLTNGARVVLCTTNIESINIRGSKSVVYVD